MRFKRFLAIILLLILPLQSTLAAIDICCSGAPSGEILDANPLTAEPFDGADDENCCAKCDFCNHPGGSFVATPASQHTRLLTIAPVPHPEPPIDSFIPDVPAPPDRA